ncbi:TPA: fimbrial protein [Serratia marcescens]
MAKLLLSLRQVGVGLPLILLSFSKEVVAADNLQLHGKLVAEPCIVQAGDGDIQLDFGAVIDKYLYLNKRTLGQVFELRLSDCDISIGKTVSVSFKGMEDPHSLGLLALSANSEARGIAIGMETVQGQALPINNSSEKFLLQNGKTVIGIRAYVQGESDALINRSIVRGQFNATATFNLDYQ